MQLQRDITDLIDSSGRDLSRKLCALEHALPVSFADSSQAVQYNLRDRGHPINFWSFPVIFKKSLLFKHCICMGYIVYDFMYT